MAFSLKSLFSGSGSAGNATPSATVGIDIGDASVKVVELEEVEGTLRLKTYGELQLGPYGGAALGESVALENKKRIEAVVDVMREANVETKHGALSMPLASSFMTVVPIMLGANEELGNRIPVEAKKYVPLPLNDVTLDWNELPALGEASNTTEVMIAAIENRALSEYHELLNTIGMTGEPAEIEAFSLVRALTKKTDKTLAIVDIGARTSKMYIVRDGTLERLHRVTGGGTLIAKRLSELLNISFADAENLKRVTSGSGEHSRDVYKAMTSVIEGPLQEFKRIISQYESRLGEPIGRVTLSGGVSLMPGLLPYAHDLLASEVEIGNPFSKVAFPAFMEDTLKEAAPIFGVSLGAALRRFVE